MGKGRFLNEFSWETDVTEAVARTFSPRLLVNKSFFVSERALALGECLCLIDLTDG